MYLLIPHATESRVLMVPTSDGWTLPRVLSNGRDLSSMGEIATALTHQMELNATVLRVVQHRREGENQSDGTAVTAVENHTPDWSPPGDARWVDRAVLVDLPLAIREHRGIIDTWWREEGEAPTARSPWAHRGWFDRTADWICAQNVDGESLRDATISQFRVWGISCVLRVQLPHRRFYFKAAAPMFQREPVITELLARRFPHNVPVPVALHRENGWMLLEDFGDEPRGSLAPAEQEEILRLLARMQIACTDLVDEMLSAGFRDGRLETLPGELDHLMEDPVALSGLSSSERDTLNALIPVLKAAIFRLGAYAIPQTLLHGDFHLGNMRVVNGIPLIFDWTDAAVAHPFIDLSPFLDSRGAEHDHETRTRLCTAYLSEWAAYESMERLQETLRLAEPLGALQQVMSYRSIVAGLEKTSQWEMGSAPVFWLRAMIESARKIAVLPYIGGYIGEAGG